MNVIVSISIIGIFVSLGGLLFYLATFSIFPVVVRKDKNDIITFCYCRNKYKNQIIKRITNAIDVEVD